MQSLNKTHKLREKKVKLEKAQRPFENFQSL